MASKNELKKEYNAQYYLDNKDKILEQKKQYRLNNKDKMAGRIKQWQLDNKDKVAERRRQYRLNNKKKIAQYRQDNKEKIAEKAKQYQLNNKEKIAEKAKQYYLDNKDRIMQYRSNNKDKIKKQNNHYISIRRKEDPLFKLRDNISNSINKALKRNGSSKQGESILKYLPYTIEELKLHLELQFEPWMNWDNHGRVNSNKRTWQIDHIEAHSKFHYKTMEDPDFIKCWALSNLQPLDAFANLKKSNS